MSAARSKEPALHYADRARDVAEFCLRHGGRCFADWPVPTLFQYAFFHIVDRTVFLARHKGALEAVGFCWGAPEADVRARAAAGASPFQWRRSADHADSLFLAEVIGERSELPRIAKQMFARWPNWRDKKIFTFRAGRLVQLPTAVIERMVQYGR